MYCPKSLGWGNLKAKTPRRSQLCVCVCLCLCLCVHRKSEKFETDLRSLQPASDNNFLNPRLSISTRFLSRFQNRLRSVPHTHTHATAAISLSLSHTHTSTPSPQLMVFIWNLKRKRGTSLLINTQPSQYGWLTHTALTTCFLNLYDVR